MTRLSQIVKKAAVSDARAKRIADSVSRLGKVKDSTGRISQYLNLARQDGPDVGAVTAGLMSNFAKAIADSHKEGRTLRHISDAKEAAMFTTQGDFGPYIMQVWPLVTAWYAEFPLKDLVSVQDMDQDLGYLFFSRLKTGTNQAPTVAGDVVETATGSRVINGYYPNGQVVGETIENAEDFDFEEAEEKTFAMLAYDHLKINDQTGRALKKTRLVITQAHVETIYVPLNVVGTTIHFAALATPTVDANITLTDRGVITIPDAGTGTAGSKTATVEKVVASYYRDLDFADQKDIQRVKEDVEKVVLQAEARAIELEWTVFAEYLKKSQFGQDIKTDNTKRILNLLYQYDTRLILDELYNYAEGNSGVAATISINSSTAISLDVKVQDVLQQLKAEANKIEIESGRIEGNRIVCGQIFKTFVESLPETWFKKDSKALDGYGFSTPRHIGTLSTFEIYYDPARQASEGFMTYRGSEFYDAAYYLGVYMPIVPTDCVTIGVDIKEAFCSMEAYEFHKPKCVNKLNFQLV